MIYTDCTDVVRAKEFFGKCRKAINYFIALCAILGFIYIGFWFVGITDEGMYERGKDLLSPLISMFYSGMQTPTTFKDAGLIMFALSIPASLLYGVINKIEELVAFELNKKMTNKIKKEEQKAFLDSLKEFNAINNYTICLSIDYKSKDTFSKENKYKLNMKVYDKIEQLLKRKAPEVSINKSDAMILCSHVFEKYDTVYDSLINILSQIKPQIEDKYDVLFIPSITTDAYTKYEETDKIKEKHYGIQKCISSNRAITTAMFAKKYKHIEMKKYTGIPIGAYIAPNNIDTYELNIINKNLSKTLAGV